MAWMTRRIALRVAAAALCLPFAGSTAFADVQTAPVSADALFGAARTALANQHYPTRLSYSIAVRYDTGDDSHQDLYSGSVDGSGENYRVDQFSDRERENPSTPHGTNIGIMSDTNVVNKQKSVGSIWIPDLSPIYSFGLRRCPTPDVTAGAGDTSARTIGRVLSVNRTYDVESLGSETLEDGVRATHLALTPLANPNANRVRDVWIDAANTIVQARVAGNFTSRATEHVPWLIRFKTIAGANYVESETSEGPVSIEGRTFDTVTILFYNVGNAVQFGFQRAARSAQFALPQDGSQGENLTEPANGNAC